MGKKGKNGKTSKTKEIATLTEYAKNPNHKWTREQWTKFSNQLANVTVGGLLGERGSIFGFDSDSYQDKEPYEIRERVLNDDLTDLRKMSRDYFKVSGFYSRTLLYYATMLHYYYILSPNFATVLGIDPSFEETYYEVLNFIAGSKVPEMFGNVLLNVLIEGAYYGLVREKPDGNGILLQQLPTDYCQSSQMTLDGVDLVDFDVSYFDSIRDEDDREMILDTLPAVIQTGYKDYEANKDNSSLATVGVVGSQSYWVTLSVDEGVAVLANNSRPPFVAMAPTITNLEIYRDMELAKDEADLHRLVIQKIPMTKDGELSLSLDEVSDLHTSVATMLQDTQNVELITTFADVTTPSLKDSRQLARDNIDKVEKSAFTEAGVSKDLFSPENSLSVSISQQNDLAFVMSMIDPLVKWFELLLQESFSGTDFYFSFDILPVTYYNQDDLVSMYRQNAQSGFSTLLPAIAAGTPQHSVINLLRLEHEVLGVHNYLKPLPSSHTQSGGTENEDKKTGRPELKLNEKSDKTIANIDSEGKGGA